MPTSVLGSLGVAALGWVASPSVKYLFEKSKEYLSRDTAKELKDLETILLPQFQLTIKAAQDSPHADELNKWLVRLKNAYYDAETILHELEYERLRNQVEDAEKKRKTLPKLISTVTEKVSEKVPRFSKTSEQISKEKLWQRLKELKEVAAQAKIFQDLLGKQIGDADDTPFATTAHLCADTVFGRDEVRDEIIEFLLKQQEAISSMSNRHLVVAITGVGGAGKTTLAQYVYNDERVTKHFGSMKIWLCLSHQKKMYIMERTKEMVVCVSGDEYSNLCSATVLQNKLIETLSGAKAVLLVLDDVWYDEESKAEQWDILLAPFRSLGERCKVVITSRSQRFPVALLPGKHISLKDLADDAFQKLFMHHSLHDLENNTHLNDLNLLRHIGDQIAKKMSTTPLAAKVVGNQLREHPNISFWLDTLENVNLNEIMDVLQWSYQRLNPQLQRCFLIFSVFPKGTRFTASETVNYWIALDFIHPSNDKTRALEDIGLEYFKKMVANSIFQLLDGWYTKHEFQLLDGWYTMHDLYHDLAEKLSAGDCFRITDSEKNNPESTVQHMFLGIDNQILKEKLSSISKLLNLRSLTLGNSFIEDEDMNEILSMICKNFKNLRVLEIWSCGYKSLPKDIRKLRNLRYLDIYRSSLVDLPDSVSQLYHLQFLALPESLKTLPVNLSSLIKLRNIEKYDNNFNHVHTLPPVPYIGKLTSLQSLQEFHVRKEEGYDVGQLGSLRQICDHLRIVNLENVRDKDEAIGAMLKHKHKLKRLELVWSLSAESSSQVDIIETLQPPKDLRLFTIDGYKGSNYPTWLQEGSSLKNLRHVRFHNCIALSSLPPNFHQFRCCAELVLENLERLRELTTFSENLSSLRIIKCPSLILKRENELQVDLNQLRVIMERELSGITIPSESIKKIFDHEIKSFEQTGSLENCPHQLQIIQNTHRRGYDALQLLLNVISAWLSCHQQRMNFILGGSSRANKLKLPLGICILELQYCCISDGALSDCLEGMVALEELHLEGIMTITTLPPSQVLQSLESLRVMKIKDCWCLRSLGGLHILPQLQEFQVHSCYVLETRGAQLPPCLQSFFIVGCKLHGNILSGYLPCLHNVFIAGCLVSFPISFGHISSFKSLVLLNCVNFSSGNLPLLRNGFIASWPVSFSLSFDQLTSLKELFLLYNRYLFFILGLHARPFIDTIAILQLPDLIVESVVQCWRGCRHLQISSSVMLNKILSFQHFLSPQILWMNGCEEEVITFEKSDRLQAIKNLGFIQCKTKNLPTSLSDFSALENVIFRDCPQLSELPELPDSIQYIEISGCPLLKERCRPNGPDWHKIQRIQDKWIQ